MSYVLSNLHKSDSKIFVKYFRSVVEKLLLGATLPITKYKFTFCPWYVTCASYSWRAVAATVVQETLVWVCVCVSAQTLNHTQMLDYSVVEAHANIKNLRCVCVCVRSVMNAGTKWSSAAWMTNRKRLNEIVCFLFEWVCISNVWYNGLMILRESVRIELSAMDHKWGNCGI